MMWSHQLKEGLHVQLEGPPLKYFLPLPRHLETKVPSLYTSPMSFCSDSQVFPCTHREKNQEPHP